MKQIKVLHIAPGFLFGGIESRLVDWYDLIDRDKVQFDVIKVTPDQPNPLVDQIRSFGGKVFSIPPLGLRTISKHIKAVNEIMTAGQYDVVHSHSLSYGFFPFKVAKRMGIKTCVLHSRTTANNPGDKHVLISECLGKMTIPLASHYFACSEEAGSWAFGDKRAVTVVRNGIALNRFAFDPKIRCDLRTSLHFSGDNQVIGSVCRLSSPKNIPYMLKVFSEIKKLNRQARFIIVGDGPLLQPSQAMALELGLSECILFAGRQDCPENWLAAMDVFVFPSIFEGFGTTAIEAQAVGLPCYISETVPHSVEVTDLVQFLPISETPAYWAQQIVSEMNTKWRNHIRDLHYEEQVRTKGYDVVNTAKWLEAFYLSRAT